MIDKKRDYGEIRNPFFLMVGTGRFELPTSTVSVCFLLKSLNKTV